MVLQVSKDGKSWYRKQRFIKGTIVYFNQSRVRRLGKVKATVPTILMNTKLTTGRNKPDIIKFMELNLDQKWEKKFRPLWLAFINT